MLRRSTHALALALVLLTALASPALAGGWAVATLDSAPAVFRAGESYPIGFTIRQHGVTPVRAEQFGGEVAVRIRSDLTGSPIVFPARTDGPVGHYVADVRFPREGAWSWEILQGRFAPQPLGALTVQAAPALAPAPVAALAPAAMPTRSVAAPAPPGTSPDFGVILLVAAPFAVVAATLALVALARRPDLAA